MASNVKRAENRRKASLIIAVRWWMVKQIELGKFNALPWNKKRLLIAGS